MACIVAQHDRIQPTTIRASLIHPPKGPTGTQQEKLGRPAATTCPQPRQSRSTHASTFSQARRWIKAKAGNTHVRRLLIEAAWHHRKSYSTSGPSLRARWAKVDPALRARGHAGNRRLYTRWQGFTERKKNPLWPT